MRENVLPTLKMNQSRIAKVLKVSRYAMSQIIHERRLVTTDIAIRLARFLGGTPDSWLKMQRVLDIWLLERKHSKDYENIRLLIK